MPEFLHPGVFVLEVPSGVRPIEGVSTSTAAFIGKTARGIPNKATFITKWEEFVGAFGGIAPDCLMTYAVNQFFDNGGKRCYVVRVLNELSAVTATRDLPSRQVGGARQTLRVSARGAGAWGNDIGIVVDDAAGNPTGTFSLTVTNNGESVEVFDELSMDPNSLTYVETEINDVSKYITVEDRNALLVSASARRASTNPLADPVPLNANETLVIETPDGVQTTITFAGAAARAAVLTQINTQLAPLNVAASLDATNHLVIQGNATGFDRYFILSGTATGAGRPFEGLAGFAQGSGAAVGAVLKSNAAPAFNIAGGGDVLTFTLGADNFDVNLTQGPARTPLDIANDLNADFQNTHNRILTASVEGNRVVVSTTNLGSAATLAISGNANGVLGFQNAARTAANAAGLGHADPAFVQSAAGPFSVGPGSNFDILVNNGALGAASAAITITFTPGPAFQNLQAVTAAELVAAINTAAPAGTVTARVVSDRVIIQQTRAGNYYTLQIRDGIGSPNIRLKFSTAVQRGYADGDPASPFLRPEFNPDAAGVNRPWQLQGGDDGSAVTDIDFVGSADAKTGLHALDAIKDVNFIAIPGNFSIGVISAAVGYCTNRKDCFLIVDSPGKVTPTTPATAPVAAQDFLLNHVTPKTSYGALYYPWLLVDDPVGKGKNPTRYVPPSGFIAGLYARIDNSRGVWKAPAGTEATLSGPIGLEHSVSDAEQDVLNPYGVNCIRQFPATGIISWGARTLAAQSDPEYRYVPVRRYTIYLEQSILRGTQWAVFEPNDQPLWDSLKANVDDFMMGEFRAGALAGRTPEEAFAVKCDADLNPPSEVNAGRVNVEVKFAPLKPAEFVIIRISQKVQRPAS